MIGIINCLQSLLDRTRSLDFLAPLALRLYLVPVFLMAGSSKLVSADPGCLFESGTACDFDFSVKQDIIDWFGNPDWGLNLPFPEIMAYLAAYTEFFGALLLLVGLAVRWISVPLMATMAVAAVTVHLQNGWLAIAEGTGMFATERTQGAIERLDQRGQLFLDHRKWQPGNPE